MSRLSDPTIIEGLESIRGSVDGLFSGRRVLITGGAGFIGGWLCDALIAQGATVDCVDDMSTGLMRNVNHLVNERRFKFVKCDVTRSLPMAEKWDFIFHLASHPSPEEYQEHPVETIIANSQGTQNILEAVRQSDAAVLFASSSEVYGNAQVIPTPETYWGNVNPIGPRSCYDEGKRFGEALCMAYNRAYGVDIRIARIFNTYGPRLRADGLYARALSRFMTQALTGSNLTVYGKGDQTRSFSYVTDTVLALLLAAIKPEMKAQVINIGNPSELSILSLAQTIIRIVRSISEITFHDRPIDDPQRRCPDISRAGKLLSWAPRVGLEEGLSKTANWFKANMVG